jgi:hypothetical protein
VDPKTPSTSIGDGIVQFSYDVTDLSASYYQPEGGTYWNAHCDVGPTHNGSRVGIPEPDDQVQFEDLMIFSMNYGVVAPRARLEPAVASSSRPVLELRVPPTPGSGTFTARLVLSGNRGVVKGLHSRIVYDRSRLELEEVEKGALVQPEGIFFASVNRDDGVVVDAAQLGEDLAFAGSGEVAILTFRVRGMGGRVDLAEANLRDVVNRDLLDVKSEQVVQADPVAPSVVTLPSVVEFRGAQPNPFTGRTELTFALPQECGVMLRVYDISGRLVRTVADGVFAAGEHRLAWDGRADDGRQLGAGIYFAEFRTGKDHRSQKLFVTR